MKLLGFLITILIAGILFGFGSMIRFFKSVLGFETKPKAQRQNGERSDFTQQAGPQQQEA